VFETTEINEGTSEEEKRNLGLPTSRDFRERSGLFVIQSYAKEREGE